jgi:hypothetical protein
MRKVEEGGERRRAAILQDCFALGDLCGDEVKISK